MPTLPHPRVEVNAVFGRWTVIAFSSKSSDNRNTSWTCRCECGTTKTVLASNLRQNSRSCGCLRSENLKTAFGDSSQQSPMFPLYTAWKNIRARCYYKGSTEYYNYGARGISVCDKWRTDYAIFKSWAETTGYCTGLQIDRINGNGNYEPGNCRWVTSAVNGRNRSITKMITAFGETKSMGAWTEDSRCVVGYNTLRGRIKKGWDAETALSLSPRFISPKGYKSPRKPNPAKAAPVL